MLVERRRIEIGTNVAHFRHLTITARSIRVLPITPEIAAISVSLGLNGDPADRLIAATTVHHSARLLTSDHRLRDASNVPTVW